MFFLDGIHLNNIFCGHTPENSNDKLGLGYHGFRRDLGSGAMKLAENLAGCFGQESV